MAHRRIKIYAQLHYVPGIKLSGMDTVLVNMAVILISLKKDKNLEPVLDRLQD